MGYVGIRGILEFNIGVSTFGELRSMLSILLFIVYFISNFCWIGVKFGFSTKVYLIGKGTESFSGVFVWAGKENGLFVFWAYTLTISFLRLMGWTGILFVKNWLLGNELLWNKTCGVLGLLNWMIFDEGLTFICFGLSTEKDLGFYMLRGTLMFYILLIGVTGLEGSTTLLIIIGFCW